MAEYVDSFERGMKAHEIYLRRKEMFRKGARRVSLFVALANPFVIASVLDNGERYKEKARAYFQEASALCGSVTNAFDVDGNGILDVDEKINLVRAAGHGDFIQETSQGDFNVSLEPDVDLVDRNSVNLSLRYKMQEQYVQKSLPVSVSALEGMLD